MKELFPLVLLLIGTAAHANVVIEAKPRPYLFAHPVRTGTVEFSGAAAIESLIKRKIPDVKARLERMPPALARAFQEHQVRAAQNYSRFVEAMARCSMLGEYPPGNTVLCETGRDYTFALDSELKLARDFSRSRQILRGISMIALFGASGHASDSFFVENLGGDLEGDQLFEKLGVRRVECGRGYCEITLK